MLKKYKFLMIILLWVFTGHCSDNNEEGVDPPEKVSFNSLPIEMVIQVLDKLDFVNMLKTASVSKIFNQAVGFNMEQRFKKSEKMQEIKEFKNLFSGNEITDTQKKSIRMVCLDLPKEEILVRTKALHTHREKLFLDGLRKYAGLIIARYLSFPAEEIVRRADSVWNNWGDLFKANMDSKIVYEIINECSRLKEEEVNSRISAIVKCEKELFEVNMNSYYRGEIILKALALEPTKIEIASKLVAKVTSERDRAGILNECQNIVPEKIKSIYEIINMNENEVKKSFLLFFVKEYKKQDTHFLMSLSKKQFYHTLINRSIYFGGIGLLIYKGYLDFFSGSIDSSDLRASLSYAGLMSLGFILTSFIAGFHQNYIYNLSHQFLGDGKIKL